MKRILYTVCLAIAALSLSACDSKKDVSFDTLETARLQARDNALYNAQLYRAQSPRIKDFDIVPHGDSSQKPDCPQGDGWASISFMKVEGNTLQKYTAKCSTVSSVIGCYLDADFKQKKEYASDDGVCQPVSKVPFPLPKLQK